MKFQVVQASKGVGARLNPRLPVKPSIYHRITDWSGLEGTSGDHPAQPPAQAGSPRAGCRGPCPGGSGISPEKETPKPHNAGPSRDERGCNRSGPANGRQKERLSVRRVVAGLVNLSVSLPGNLYSRHIQIDGEVLAIQVQDTPGVQVSSMPPRVCLWPVSGSGVPHGRNLGL